MLGGGSVGKMLPGQAGGPELGAPVPKPKGRHSGMHLCATQLLKVGRLGASLDVSEPSQVQGEILSHSIREERLGMTAAIFDRHSIHPHVQARLDRHTHTHTQHTCTHTTRTHTHTHTKNQISHLEKDAIESTANFSFLVPC